MAGGVFFNQNKIRPGAYINFKKDTGEINYNGSRGIVTFACNLDWGAENTLITLTDSDLVSGKSLAKVGLMSNDSGTKLINAALANATVLKLFRLNYGGVKAAVTSGNLTATAKYSGTFGNKIAILITSVGSVFEVNTYADGYLVDTQRASTVADLESNEFVDFSGTGALAAISASVLLTGGTNGSTAVATAYAAYFTLLRATRWTTLAICNNGSTVNADTVTLIRELRNNEGKYVQAVLANYSSADYEGIINNVNGCVINGVSYTAEEFTTYVAGMTAGADAFTSNTGKIIKGGTEIVGALTNASIISGLKAGQFILSLNQDGAVKVEQDINSLHNYTDELDYNFTKNKVLRVLDTIGSAIQGMWENSFLGKVANNADGRDLFKSTIITYLNDLQAKGAIENFEGASDVTVSIGENIDAVEANIRIKPVDAMEFLYLTVNVVS